MLQKCEKYSFQGQNNLAAEKMQEVLLHHFYCKELKLLTLFKGIVSLDFRGLEMILMDR